METKFLFAASGFREHWVKRKVTISQPVLFPHFLFKEIDTSNWRKVYLGQFSFFETLLKSPLPLQVTSESSYISVCLSPTHTYIHTYTHTNIWHIHFPKLLCSYYTVIIWHVSCSKIHKHIFSVWTPDTERMWDSDDIPLSTFEDTKSENPNVLWFQENVDK